MIDDNALEIRVNSLRAAKMDALLRAERLEKLLNVFMSIQKRDGELKSDPYTNQPITETRRQEVWDACTPEADKFIAYVPPEKRTVQILEGLLEDAKAREEGRQEEDEDEGQDMPAS